MMDNLQAFLDQMKIEMANQTKDIILRMDEKLAPLVNEIADLRLENQQLKDKITRMDTYRRRNNVIIYGIKENENSSVDLLNITTDKINKDLNISIQNKDIDAIYRIGKKDEKNKKTRPILLTFVNGWRKKEILANRKKLKHIYASEDYPKEILDKRKELLPKLKEERNKGNVAFLKYDKLIIKEGHPVSEKRKRAGSTPPETPMQPRKQYATSKINRTNAFEVMRARSNSSSTNTPTSEYNK